MADATEDGPGRRGSGGGGRMRPLPLLPLAVVGGGVHFTIVSVSQLFFVLYASALGASPALIGLMVTLRAILPLLLSLPSGGLIDRIGALRVLQLGGLGTIAALALMIWSPTLVLLAASQALIGLTTLLTATSLQVLVSAGSKAERDPRIATYSAWCSGGNMVGPLIGGAVASGVNALPAFAAAAPVAGYRAAFLAILVLIAVFVLLVTLAGRAAPPATPKSNDKASLTGFREGLALARLPGVQYGLMGTFLIHFLQSVWTSFFPLFLEQLGYAAFAISVFVALRGGAALLSRAALPRVMKLASQERILAGAGCVAALCLMAIPALGPLPVALGLLTVLLGAATGINMPVSTIIMVDDTHERDRGKVMGLRLLTNRASQVVGPAAFGVAGGAVGLGAAFVSGGALLLALLLGFAGLAGKRPPSGS